MNSEDFKVFLGDLVDCLNELEEAAEKILKGVRKLKQHIGKLMGIEVSGKWRVIESPTPVLEDDRAVQWLKKKLEAIGEKHPSLRYDFAKDPAGLITGLRYMTEDKEVQKDVEAVCQWAFQKASKRPTSSSAS